MNVYNIGIKLIGIYFIATGASALPALLLLFGEPDLSLTYILAITQPVIILFIGFMVFFNSEKIVSLNGNNDDNKSDRPLNFVTAIQLTGLYLVANSSGIVLGQIAVRIFSILTENQEVIGNMALYQRSFLIFIGLVLIVKAKKIALYIKETT